MIYAPETRDAQREAVTHAFSRLEAGEEWALLPLCWQATVLAGEECPSSPAGEGLRLTPVVADVTCPECRELIHA